MTAARTGAGPADGGRRSMTQSIGPGLAACISAVSRSASPESTTVRTRGPKRRRRSSSVAEECVYTDPTSVSHGHLELTAKMQATQRNYPGASFRNDRFVEHHCQAISQWTMNDGKGQPIFVGQSFACFDRDGRLTKMTGFFEPAI
jgi:hypothetical protein